MSALPATRDHADRPPKRLVCSLNQTGLYPTLILALRDMREANGRHLETGEGTGNVSWIGLTLGMVVLDTLSGEKEGVRARWEELLTNHGISDGDAKLIYELRCSLLHGYGLPKPEKVDGALVGLSGRHHGFAIDRPRSNIVDLSVPLFCSHLVERIASEAPDDWDVASIRVNAAYLPG